MKAMRVSRAASSSDQAKHTLRSERRKRVVFRCLMLLLPVTHFVLFWVIPNFRSILYAFQYNRVGADMFYHREWSLIQFRFVWEELTRASGNQLLPSIKYPCRRRCCCLTFCIRRYFYINFTASSSFCRASYLPSCWQSCSAIFLTRSTA